MAKRKLADVHNETDVVSNRRSSRRKTSNEETLPVPKGKRPATAHAEKRRSAKARKEIAADPVPRKEFTAITKPSAKIQTEDETPRGQQYWLMKAEPEPRLEKGHDVSFSIDDLAAKKQPEPWDGIRAFPARNNLRAMNKGDLAFFYHSNCKIPAIVGIMEIVRGHSPDMSAQDPDAPYHDPKDVDATNPKWSVVHVEFRRRLREQITLKDLRGYAAKGQPLENMQMLRQSRLSVSRVSREEWEFLMGVIREREGDEG